MPFLIDLLPEIAVAKRRQSQQNSDRDRSPDAMVAARIAEAT